MTLLRALILLITAATCGYTQPTSEYTAVSYVSLDGSYTWEEVMDDPTGTRFYTLNNGLTVILSPNRLEPRIMCLFVTRAGSKHDPADNTGLAHYLEHMLFKGTDRYGSLDFKTEKIYLDEIEALYEAYNTSKDENERRQLYRQIDSVSLIASRYAIANEYDKMMSAIGSNMTNAFTSFENTTYMENFPSNQLEKFLEIQRERFRNPVLRLFHTELEAVYEEKNISLDNGSSKVFEAMFASLFKKHPYGTQTTIGTVEHLKNPSLKAIKAYYDRYYVPNNMALILTGDLDMDETIALVDRYFSDWTPRPLPPLHLPVDPPLTQREELTVFSPDEASVAIGFRMPSALDKEATLADLVSAILYNGKSGLIDRNLVKSQQVLEAYGFNYLLQDHGIFYFGGKALEGQSLEQVRTLLIAEVDKLRRGEFDEDLIAATVNNLLVDRIREQENAMNMAFTLHDQYVIGKPWTDYLADVDAMSRITKAQVMDFARRWFGDQYTVVYKRTGEDPNVQKVDKPEINPVEVNRDARSPFLARIVDTPVPPLQPVFLDYERDIQKAEIKPGVALWMTPNTINQLYSLYYVVDMGRRHDPLLGLAITYLEFLGTQARTNEDINKSLYRLATDFNIFAGDDQVYVSLSGLQENMHEALIILEDLLANAQPDQEALDRLIEATIKERQDNLLNKRSIFWGGMLNYSLYGPSNPFNNILTNEQLRAVKAEDLIARIRQLMQHPHRVLYYGPWTVDHMVAYLRQHHRMPATLLELPTYKTYERQSPDEDIVYLVDYDMVQAEVAVDRWAGDFDADKLPLVSAFNEYYGGGMASVVFQDIRESRALAYSAFSTFARPSRQDEPFSARFYIGTQADKLPDAMAAMHQLLDHMPESEALWDVGRRSIRQGIESRRITKENILFNYQSALRLGMMHDVRRDIYLQVEQMSLADLRTFHQQHFANQRWVTRVIGKKDRLDLQALGRYGRIVELNLEELFGYKPANQTAKP
jgi:predicted Zn-dependent peptidase